MSKHIIVTEKYFDNKEDNFQDFTYYTVREGMHIHLYRAIKEQNEYIEKLERKVKRLQNKIKKLVVEKEK